jgi:putative membrane protein
MNHHAALSDTGRARIREATAAAEAKTAGEIFVVVARASDDYRFVPLLWATLAALCVPLPLVFLTLLPALTIYLLQLLVFVLLAIVLSVPPIHMLTVPKRMQRERAHGLAVDQFLAHGLHTTEARTGVLVFVSLAERYAEIVADAGIAGKVEQAVWDGAIAGLLAEIRAGRLVEGLTATITEAGAILARHFPPRTDDRDELSNELILL